MKGQSLLLVLFVMSIHQNCTQANFEKAPTSVLGEDQEKLKKIEAACNTGPLQNQTHNISFPSNLDLSPNNTVCQWDHNDSGPIYGSGRAIAMNQEDQPLSLPPNATLCDVAFNISNQSFYYDDMFFLNFNDVIIVSASNFFTGFPDWLGYDLFDWSLMKGQNFPPSYNENAWIYCAGSSQGTGSCTVPRTEQSGDFRLSYDRSLIQRIGLRGGNNHKFSLIVTGDDDPDIDCRHETLNFSVNVSYVVN